MLTNSCYLNNYGGSVYCGSCGLSLSLDFISAKISASHCCHQERLLTEISSEKSKLQMHMPA